MALYVEDSWQISKNFSMGEFTASATAKRKKIDNRMPSKYKWNSVELVKYILQPLRNKFGRLDINSGFRCEELNKAVKGSVTSDHMTGSAADIVSDSHSVKEMAEFIAGNMLPFHQLIEEYKLVRRRGKLVQVEWLHVSCTCSHSPKREWLIVEFDKNRKKHVTVKG